MDPMERANVLFSVFKSCVEHGPKFGSLMSAAARELKEINDEAAVAEAKKAEAEQREASRHAEKVRQEQKAEADRQREEEAKRGKRPLVTPVDPAIAQPSQLTEEEREELQQREEEKLRNPQPYSPSPLGPPSPSVPYSHEESPRRL